jgi:hypothetical protein
MNPANVQTPAYDLWLSDDRTNIHREGDEPAIIFFKVDSEGNYDGHRVPWIRVWAQHGLLWKTELITETSTRCVVSTYKTLMKAEPKEYRNGNEFLEASFLAEPNGEPNAIFVSSSGSTVESVTEVYAKGGTAIGKLVLEDTDQYPTIVEYREADGHRYCAAMSFSQSRPNDWPFSVNLERGERWWGSPRVMSREIGPAYERWIDGERVHAKFFRDGEPVDDKVVEMLLQAQHSNHLDSKR